MLNASTTGSPGPSIAVVNSEDRADCELGIRVLAASLERWFPQAEVHLFAPNASEALQDFLASTRAKLHPALDTRRGKTNIKADALLWALDQGYDYAIWFDSDIVLSGSVPAALVEAHPDMVAAQVGRRARNRTHDATIPWGFAPGRRFLQDPSSCILRVTNEHRGFLHLWNAMLSSPDYLEATQRPWTERPVHLAGDDALFAALLGSKDYEDLSLRTLSTGRHIAWCASPASYTLRERLLSAVFGPPPFVHAVGPKPWLNAGERPHQALSPYAAAVSAYEPALGPQRSWLEPSGRWARLWKRLAGRSIPLADLPWAIRQAASELGVRSTLRNIRYYLSGG